MLAIGVKTLLFPRDTDSEADTALRVAFEKCRAIGKHFYKSETHKAQWQRTKKREDLQGNVPRLDSNAKWESSEKMAAGHFEARHLISAYAQDCCGIINLSKVE